MSASLASFTYSRLAGAVAALWLCGAGAAWAGDGGADLGSLQALLSTPNTGFCAILKMTSCPQLPTVTQAVLEVAGLTNSPPEMIAAQNNVPPGNSFPASNVTAGNQAAVPVDGAPTPFPLNSTTSPTLSQLLSTLTPLAFVTGPNATGGTVTLSTNGTTAVGNTTLNFTSTNRLVTGQAYSIVDTTKPAAIPPGTTTGLSYPNSPAITPSTVTMSANAAGPGVGSGDRITFTPIANPAAATQLYNQNADAFLYAVGVSSLGFTSFTGLTDPDTAYFFYEDLFRDNQSFNKGQIVAKFSFPLTVLNSNGSETPVMITLQIQATCNGGPSCLQAYAYVSGGANGALSNSAAASLPTAASNQIPASKLGINFALVFDTSPTLTKKHAIFEVAVPLLVTGACSPTPCSPDTDPAYFYTLHTNNPGPINTAIYTAFGFVGDDLGAPLPNGASIGLAPTAGPLGPPPSCNPSGCTPPLSTFALCASLPDDSNGPNARLLPAVGAYYAIATDGETLLSAALPAVSTSTCPQL